MDLHDLVGRFVIFFPVYSNKKRRYIIEFNIWFSWTYALQPQLHLLLPAHYFETIDSQGNAKDFNLIDGGVAANNPVYIKINSNFRPFLTAAIGEVIKTIINRSEDFFPIKPMDYRRFDKYLLWTADKKNLDDLLKVGEGLFKKPVCRVNLETGRVEPCKHESNEEALTRFARLLSEEKWLRLARSPVGHAANPN
ncbi:hypothetical protein DVH24_020763 [Malus domestica]|uniref:PNPLA domain-containing protein n=1 Tax=Malus domestica TaxID=3750 RepID=A0A498J8E4_MALDO|nr:hypothetical protein DVH24_020763 [Malus domestica]